MLDSHAVSPSLTDADFTPARADAITRVVRLAAEQGDHVTSGQFTASVAEVRTEIAALDTRDSRRRSPTCAPEQGIQTAQVPTEIAEVRTEIATIETRLIRWMVRHRSRDGDVDGGERFPRSAATRRASAKNG